MKHGKKTLKNIIIVNDYAYINGGAAKVAIQSAMALTEVADINVFYFSAVGPIDENLKNSTVRTTCLFIDDINSCNNTHRVLSGIWNTKAKKSFKSFLQDFSNEDTVIHFHGWVKSLSSSTIALAMKMGFTSIISLHDYFTLCPNGGFYNFHTQSICNKRPMSMQCIICNCDKRNYAQKIWRVLRQIVQDRYVRYNSKLAFISLSDINERIVREFVKSKKLIRVQNPVQLAPQMIVDCTRSNVYLFVGRLSSEKGAELFCQAIEDLKTEYNIMGVVIGDGECRKDLNQKYPNVSFWGWKSAEEVSYYMQTSRVVVIPSKWYEAAPPLLELEAYSASLPSIISDCCAATELIKDGENGYIFKSNDIESLKETIIKTMDDNALKEVQENIKKSMTPKLYELSTHANRLINVYENCLNDIKSEEE